MVTYKKKSKAVNKMVGRSFKSGDGQSEITATHRFWLNPPNLNLAAPFVIARLICYS